MAAVAHGPFTAPRLEGGGLFFSHMFVARSRVPADSQLPHFFNAAMWTMECWSTGAQVPNLCSIMWTMGCLSGDDFLTGADVLRAAHSLATGYFRWLGDRGPLDPPWIPQTTDTIFETLLGAFEVGHGRTADHYLYNRTQTAQSSSNATTAVAAASRTLATARQVSESTVFLMHVSFSLGQVLCKTSAGGGEYTAVGLFT